MLPSEWADCLIPPAGLVYIERDEQPETYGHIIIPESTRLKQKSNKATVRAVGAGTFHVKPGDRVMVAAGVGTRLQFGERAEVTYYICREQELICLFLDDDDTRIEDLGEAPLGRFPVVSDSMKAMADRLVDEGDRKRAE